MRASRRRFLSALIRASGIALGGEVARITAQDLSPDRRRTFRGRRPGEQRQVEGIPLCWCPPGRFTMGSPSQERGHRPDETQVEVTLTRGFWTAKYEATQVQWKRVMGPFPDRLPSAEFGEGDDFPVYWINFTEAEAFCARLTESGRRSGALPPEWAFTLPTEAQWEYACRAGTTTLSSFGDALSQEQANIGIETTDRTVRPRGGSRKVGSYPANPWGIHDMHGNVWEWCRDYYHPQLPGGTDPDRYASSGNQNRDGSFSRVRRGGAWIEWPSFCRAASRLPYEPHRRSDHIGFRVLVVERQPPH
jgi:formylglycine-generating enzyme